MVCRSSTFRSPQTSARFSTLEPAFQLCQCQWPPRVPEHPRLSLTAHLHTFHNSPWTDSSLLSFRALTKTPRFFFPPSASRSLLLLHRQQPPACKLLVKASSFLRLPSSPLLPRGTPAFDSLHQRSSLPSPRLSDAAIIAIISDPATIPILFSINPRATRLAETPHLSSIHLVSIRDFLSSSLRPDPAIQLSLIIVASAIISFQSSAAIGR